MISFLAWLGFLASLLVQIGSFLEWAPLGGYAFVLQVPCVLLFLLATWRAGLGTRKPTRNDCSGLAADLLVIFEPYCLIIFAFCLLAAHDKNNMMILLRMFSALWMDFFLIAAGLMATSRAYRR